MRSTWLAGVVLAVLVAATFAVTLNNGFIWDDDTHITHNAVVLAPHGLAALKLIWGSLGATPQYYPLTHTSFWIEYRLWGTHAAGYHAVSVLLHTISALLLWRILRRLGLRYAWLVALVWGVHPMQVETVAWAAERKNTLSGVFYFAAMLAYLRGVVFEGNEAKPTRKPTAKPWAFEGPRMGWLLLTYLFFVLGMLSKTVVATLPAALLVIGWWKRGRVTGRQIAALAPMFVMAFAGGTLTGWMEVHVVGAAGPEWDLTKLQRLGIAARAIWFYAAKLLWPVHYSFIYPRWSVAFGVAAAGFVICAVLVVVMLLALEGRVGRGPAAAALLFGGTLFPALGFADVYPMRFSFVAEHYAYLASAAGIALIVEPAMRWIAARWRGGAARRWSVGPVIVGAIVVTVLMLLSASRCAQFANADTLWRATLDADPNSWMAMTQLGGDAYGRQDYEQAAGFFTEALRQNPDAIEAHLGLADVLDAVDKPSAALAECEKAIVAWPNHLMPHWRAAKLLEELNRPEGARLELGKMLKIDARYEPARLELGRIDLAEGRPLDAEREARAALDRRPASFEAVLLLADALAASGRSEEAIGYYRRLLAADPGDQRVIARLARAGAAGTR